jgi:hypothetical protein
MQGGYGRSRRSGKRSLRLVVALALAACGSKQADATQQCAPAAAKGVDAVLARAKERVASSDRPADVRAKMEARTQELEQRVPRLRAIITNRCVEDRWKPDVIACYSKMSSMEEMRSCRAMLPPEHRAKLQKEELDLIAQDQRLPGFGSATVPAGATPEIAKLEAELRELNTKLGDAAKELETAKTDATRDAIKARVAVLQRQMQIINDQLATARANVTAP